jgi:soluble lytic murein transglycosylase
MRTVRVLFALVLLGCGAEGPDLLRPATVELRPAPDPGAALRSGIEAYERGDLEKARLLLELAASSRFELADHALDFLARVRAAQGDPAGAVAAWRELLEGYPDSVGTATACLGIAREHLAAGDFEEAERLAARARQESLERSTEAEALWVQAQAARQRGNLEKSRALALELRRRYPESRWSREAREAAWLERDELLQGPFSRLRQEIELRLAEGEAARALELVRSASGRYRTEAERAGLRLQEAAALGALGSRREAEHTLLLLRREHPKRPEAAEALYRLASLAWNEDRDADALHRFSVFLRAYPRATRASEALYGIGRIFQDRGAHEPAIRAFSTLLQRHPKSPLADEAAWRIGWSEYLRGRFFQAAAAFERAAERPAPFGPAALYWRARALERLQSAANLQYEQILDRFPASYYAALAEQRIGAPEGSRLRPRLAENRLPARPVLSGAFSDDAYGRRISTLLDLRLPRLARLELSRVERRWPARWDDRTFLDAWLASGGFAEALRRATRAGACQPGEPAFAYCYPLAFWDIVSRESEQHGIDPFLVLAIVRQESAYDPYARSAARALGLMQLLPSTAQRTANRVGIDVSEESLLRADANLVLGIAHLRELLDRYGGNVVRALAAYNAGTDAVARWESKVRGAEDDEFVERIGFRETRDYVRRVLANRRVYRALYEPSDVPRDGRR